MLFHRVFFKIQHIDFSQSTGQIPFSQCTAFVESTINNFTGFVEYIVFAGYTCTFTGDNWTVFLEHSLVIPGQCLCTPHIHL